MVAIGVPGHPRSVPDGRGGLAVTGDLWTGYRHVGRLGALDAVSTAALLAHLRPRLAAGDPLVLACSAELTATLRAALPSDAVVVVVDEIGLAGRASDALAAYTALVDQHQPGGNARLQLVTDTPPGGVGTAWLQTEALLNHVLSDRRVDHLCLLHRSHLGADEPQAVSCHHSLLRDDGTMTANPGRREPAEVLRALGTADAPEELESTEPVLVLLDVEDVRIVRRALQQSLAEGLLPAEDAEDLVLAIDEVTANAAEHGVPPVDVRLWITPERILCSVSDRGTGFDEPLSGYGPAHGGDLSVGGMGLWLARRAVDAMTTGTLTPEGAGCVVRLAIDPRTREPR